MQDLGKNTTLSELAKKVEREVHVISRQTVKMENDGLIKRIKDTPKSNLLRLELTEKGLEIIKVSRRSKSIDTIFSYLSPEKRKQLESTLNLILNKLEERNLV
jgi:DNA-binding MarR family transcriptional regulator